MKYRKFTAESEGYIDMYGIQFEFSDDERATYILISEDYNTSCVKAWPGGLIYFDLEKDRDEFLTRLVLEL